MRVSGEPTVPLIVMFPQKVVLAGERVKRIGAWAVPSASNRPPLAIVIPTPVLKQTMAPAGIVRVALEATVTALVTTQCVPLAQTVSMEMVPPTFTVGSWRLALARFE